MFHLIWVIGMLAVLQFGHFMLHNLLHGARLTSSARVFANANCLDCDLQPAAYPNAKVCYLLSELDGLWRVVTDLIS